MVINSELEEKTIEDFKNAHLTPSKPCALLQNTMDPIVLRWIERLLIDGGAILCCYLGYKLFIFGVEKGSAKVSAKSKVVNVIFSGTAPGLFFMASGCAILIVSLFMRMDTSHSRLQISQDRKAVASDANTNYWALTNDLMKFYILLEEEMSKGNLSLNPLQLSNNDINSGFTNHFSDTTVTPKQGKEIVASDTINRLFTKHFTNYFQSLTNLDQFYRGGLRDPFYGGEFGRRVDIHYRPAVGLNGSSTHYYPAFGLNQIPKEYRLQVRPVVGLHQGPRRYRPPVGLYQSARWHRPAGERLVNEFGQIVAE